MGRPADVWPSKVIVFTDGSSLDNGNPYARAGSAMVFSQEHMRDFTASECLPRHPLYGQTNNRAEYYAALMAMRAQKKHGWPVMVIMTDSKLLVQTWNEWLEKWMKRGTWQQKKNPDLLEQLWEFKRDPDLTISMKHVRGHQGNTYASNVVTKRNT